jgi:hypothetical protein
MAQVIAKEVVRDAVQPRARVGGLRAIGAAPGKGGYEGLRGQIGGRPRTDPAPEVAVQLAVMAIEYLGACLCPKPESEFTDADAG